MWGDLSNVASDSARTHSPRQVALQVGQRLVRLRVERELRLDEVTDALQLVVLQRKVILVFVGYRTPLRIPTTMRKSIFAGYRNPISNPPDCPPWQGYKQGKPDLF